jgi:hypothetical protein
VIECTKLIAVDLFNAEARRIRLGDVEQYLARLRNHPPSASVGGVGQPRWCVPTATTSGHHPAEA